MGWVRFSCWLALVFIPIKSKKMDCKECEVQLSDYLSAVPSKWREQLISVLCQIKEDKQNPDCQIIRDCETVTTLSDFNIDRTTASVTYIDEDSVSYNRSFDISLILNNLMNDIDPGCLMTEEDWLNLNFVSKFQAIVDSHCECCD